MREIKFKGKDIGCNEWVYGHYTEGAWIDPTDGTEVKRHIIHAEDGFLHDIDPETLEQFTGLLDKNGKEIYEGDILKVTFTNGEPIYKLVSYQPNNAAFCLVNSFSMQYDGRWDVWSSINQDWVCDVEATVAGNIHDNPELIKNESNEHRK